MPNKYKRTLGKRKYNDFSKDLQQAIQEYKNSNLSLRDEMFEQSRYGSENKTKTLKRKKSNVPPGRSIAYEDIYNEGPSTGKASATLNDEAFDEDLTVDADSDSSTASDQTDNSSENSTSFSNIAINDFIVVELKSEKGRVIRFIGKVISIEPCRCQFLRVSKKIPNGFTYPDTTDEGDIEADEFIGTLEPPEILRRTTKKILAL
ncbi:hypothetical protein FQA39_LY07867 [Lamprigera yunnana]|nr:hypothetical protein FQA39_LY07867 [Lamprigera yunnana]